MSKKKKQDSGSGSGWGALAMILIAAALAGGGHKGVGALKSAGASLDSIAAGAIPPGGAYTPRSWARAFIASVGEPETQCNKNFVVAWETAEGGHWSNTARYDPLNTTQTEPGSYRINDLGNGRGVQAFVSWHQGLKANSYALLNPQFRWTYGPILAAMRAGNDAQAAASAVTASRWGTGVFNASC